MLLAYAFLWCWDSFLSDVSLKDKVMQYNKDSHINNVDDVRKFFHYIVEVRNVNFNPDDMFEYYMLSDRTTAFTPEECEIYNHLTEECFDICEKEEADIYEIAFELLKNKIALSAGC